jgi:hypothetical protein
MNDAGEKPGQGGEVERDNDNIETLPGLSNPEEGITEMGVLPVGLLNQQITHHHSNQESVVVDDNDEWFEEDDDDDNDQWEDEDDLAGEGLGDNPLDLPEECKSSFPFSRCRIVSLLYHSGFGSLVCY